jgi:hypothetical protein
VPRLLNVEDSSVAPDGRIQPVQVPSLMSTPSILRVGPGWPRMIAAEASTLLTASGPCQASVEAPASPGMRTLRRLAQNLALAYRDDRPWQPAGRGTPPQDREGNLRSGQANPCLSVWL